MPVRLLTNSHRDFPVKIDLLKFVDFICNFVFYNRT